MVILIAGPSHTGKTVLAQKLLERYHMPYLSLDHLKMGLIRSGQTVLTPADDDQLTEYLWPIVREMIKTAIENRQDAVRRTQTVDWQYIQNISRKFVPGNFKKVKLPGCFLSGFVLYFTLVKQILHDREACELHLPCGVFDNPAPQPR